MMSHGFFDTFEKFLSHFGDECRAKEFKEFLITLAEWRITQIFVVLMKEKIYDLGDFTPNYFNLIWLPLERVENETKYRRDPAMWEHRYSETYQKLYYMYEQIAATFPKDEQAIFYMHDIPPTSLFEFLYRYFFPGETAKIVDRYKGNEINRW